VQLLGSEQIEELIQFLAVLTPDMLIFKRQQRGRSNPDSFGEAEKRIKARFLLISLHGSPKVWRESASFARLFDGKVCGVPKRSESVRKHLAIVDICHSANDRGEWGLAPQSMACIYLVKHTP